jgi:hypothetical protein
MQSRRNAQLATRMAGAGDVKAADRISGRAAGDGNAAGCRK